jgi:hypothetical protein
VFTVTDSIANSVTSSISLGTLLGISNLSARLYSYTTLPHRPGRQHARRGLGDAVLLRRRLHG